MVTGCDSISLKNLRCSLDRRPNFPGLNPLGTSHSGALGGLLLRSHAIHSPEIARPFKVERKYIVSNHDSNAAEESRLGALGYRQELSRVLGRFDSFSVAFTYLSPMVGIYSLFVLGAG